MTKRPFWIVMTPKSLTEIPRYDTEADAREAAKAVAAEAFAPVYVLQASEEWTRLLDEPERNYLSNY
jgi:hypothetical protein